MWGQKLLNSVHRSLDKCYATSMHFDLLTLYFLEGEVTYVTQNYVDIDMMVNKQLNSQTKNNN